MDKRISNDRVFRVQSQNRMDEMELTDHNETFNKVLQYDDRSRNLINKKVKIA